MNLMNGYKLFPNGLALVSKQPLHLSKFYLCVCVCVCVCCVCVGGCTCACVRACMRGCMSAHVQLRFSAKFNYKNPFIFPASTMLY